MNGLGQKPKPLQLGAVAAVHVPQQEFYLFFLFPVGGERPENLWGGEEFGENASEGANALRDLFSCSFWVISWLKDSSI